MVIVERTVETASPIDRVFDYLSRFHEYRGMGSRNTPHEACRHGADRRRHAFPQRVTVPRSRDRARIPSDPTRASATPHLRRREQDRNVN